MMLRVDWWMLKVLVPDFVKVQSILVRKIGNKLDDFFCTRIMKFSCKQHNLDVTCLRFSLCLYLRIEKFKKYLPNIHFDKRTKSLTAKLFSLCRNLNIFNCLLDYLMEFTKYKVKKFGLLFSQMYMYKHAQLM